MTMPFINGLNPIPIELVIFINLNVRNAGLLNERRLSAFWV
ncbi:hypothetical protein ADICYQ_1548 [Cyclobacterium qasimii M12-11B]|uniref:Uncharacterized protein n=1 Tax=Cyclobacterium qasimii M12-11B TaxID=641524 RepID=S7VHH9_9BACT|nr:hypothetical protein ADICYQ_1548 [Cyclobacterium qasimii M12-11B]